MTFLPKTIAIGLFAILLCNSAFAIDQLKLTTGQVVNGQVLNDTSEFVDIRLENGISKRIPHSAIASVDHDVTPHKANEVPGPPQFFASLSVGGLLLTGHTDADRVLFDYGLRAGFQAGRFGDFKLAFALSYDRASITTTLEEGVYHASGFSDYNLQMLLTPSAYSGFYFGPNIGILFRSDTIDDVDTGDGGKNFELGLGCGYTLPINETFSIGTDLRYDHDFGYTYLNLVKFMLNGTVRF